MPPSAESHNGIIRQYLINVTEQDTGRKFQQTSSTTSMTVVMLHPYYVYQFSIAVVTVSTGPYSEPIELRTPVDGTHTYVHEYLAYVTCTNAVA